MKNADMTAHPYDAQCKSNEFGGLTKREMIAMHAMQGILSGNSIELLANIALENGVNDATDVIVKMSINAADALLKELEK